MAVSLCYLKCNKSIFVIIRGSPGHFMVKKNENSYPPTCPPSLWRERRSRAGTMNLGMLTVGILRTQSKMLSSEFDLLRHGGHNRVIIPTKRKPRALPVDESFESSYIRDVALGRSKMVLLYFPVLAHRSAFWHEGVGLPFQYYKRFGQAWGCQRFFSMIKVEIFTNVKFDL